MNGTRYDILIVQLELFGSQNLIGMGRQGLWMSCCIIAGDCSGITCKLDSQSIWIAVQFLRCNRWRINRIDRSLIWTAQRCSWPWCLVIMLTDRTVHFDQTLLFTLTKKHHRHLPDQLSAYCFGSKETNFTTEKPVNMVWWNSTGWIRATFAFSHAVPSVQPLALSAVRWLYSTLVNMKPGLVQDQIVD